MNDSISREKRKDVLLKTGGLCFYCGNPLPKDITEYGVVISRWHVDHFVPRSCGGSNDIGNLVPACAECNTYKADYDIETFRVRKTKWMIRKLTRPKGDKTRLSAIDITGVRLYQFAYEHRGWTP